MTSYMSHPKPRLRLRKYARATRQTTYRTGYEYNGQCGGTHVRGQIRWVVRQLSSTVNRTRTRATIEAAPFG